MANTFKVLGQLDLAANTATTLYTVPASTSTTISTVVICNRLGTQVTFRLWVAVAGIADANKQYLYYDVPIPGNDSFAVTLGITLAATDLLRVQANSTSVEASAFGVEVT